VTQRLIYVIGPSGAGKDSVIHALQACWSLSLPVHWARRTITRAVQPGGEPHEPVTQSAFTQLLHSGALSMHWQGNGLSYGVRHSELAPLERGHCVVVTGSRAHVPVVQRVWPACTLVHITAPLEVLQRRLGARGREDAQAISMRLARAVEQDWPADTIRIVNDGSLTDAAQTLHHALAARLPSATAALS
jgi:ribose 1,5-bisphosphokinase